jgi:hypothetical protein
MRLADSEQVMRPLCIVEDVAASGSRRLDGEWLNAG